MYFITKCFKTRIFVHEFCVQLNSWWFLKVELLGQRVCTFLQAMDTHLQNAFCKVWANLYFHHQHSSTSLSLWLHLLVGITIEKKLVSFVCKNSTSLWFYFTVLIVMVNILTKLFISNFSFVNCLLVAFMIYTKGCFVGRTYETTVKIILYWTPHSQTTHPM